MRRLRSLLVVSVLCAAPSLSAQELNPRAFWPAPAGTNVISVGYAYTSGGVLVDQSLPIERGRSRSHGLKAGYVRFFGLAGRTSSLAIEIPGGKAKLTGEVAGTAEERLLSGARDASLRFAINLKGAPRMTPEQFRTEFLGKAKTLVALSLRVTAPTGHYDSDRLFNLGSNRWSAQPQIGYVFARNGWINELTAGVRFFGDNDDFVGQLLEQDPIGSAQIQVGRYMKQTRPDFWFSLGLGYSYGGRTTIDGIEKDNLLQNSDIGLTLAYPLGKGQALRFAITTQLKTSIGEDATTGLIAYSKVWR